MNAIPRIGGKRERIDGISGTTPSPLNWPTGCHFRNRCESAMDVCERVQPTLAPVQRDRRPESPNGAAASEQVSSVACHLYPESTPEEARQ